MDLKNEETLFLILKSRLPVARDLHEAAEIFCPYTISPQHLQHSHSALRGDMPFSCPRTGLPDYFYILF